MKKNFMGTELFMQLKDLKLKKRIRRNYRTIIGLIGTVAVLMIIGHVYKMFRGSEIGDRLISTDVERYEETIRRYAEEFDMEAYVPLVEAVMMQESAGRTTDPMQSSACMFNKEYDTSPGGIKDPEYSVKVGVQYLNYCLELAGCQNPNDLDKIRLALQGYNYGAGYITWAQENYGGYSLENAEEFAEMMMKKHHTSGYGDREYVPHVLRYYHMG